MMHGPARELPTSGFAIIVDGRIRIEFKREEGARNGARDLKRRLSMLQIKIYHAAAKQSEQLSSAVATCKDLRHQNASHSTRAEPPGRSVMSCRKALGTHQHFCAYQRRCSRNRTSKLVSSSLSISRQISWSACVCASNVDPF